VLIDIKVIVESMSRSVSDLINVKINEEINVKIDAIVNVKTNFKIDVKISGQKGTSIML
jgi:hypothetical protein